MLSGLSPPPNFQLVVFYVFLGVKIPWEIFMTFDFLIIFDFLNPRRVIILNV